MFCWKLQSDVINSVIYSRGSWIRFKMWHFMARMWAIKSGNKTPSEKKLLWILPDKTVMLLGLIIPPPIISNISCKRKTTSAYLAYESWVFGPSVTLSVNDERKRKFTCAYKVILINISISSHFHLNVSIKSIPLEIRRQNCRAHRPWIVYACQRPLILLSLFIFYARVEKKLKVV